VIHAKDHASVQLNIGHVNADGVFTGEFTTVALSGYVRSKQEGDQAINRAAANANLMKDLAAFPKEHLFHTAPKA